MKSDFRNNFKSFNIIEEINFERPVYTFNDLYRKQLHAERIEINGIRHYTTPDGNAYPSVTTILANTMSKEKEKILENWKKRVGDDKAEKIKNEAGKRGTIMHDLCESFIKGENFIPPKHGSNSYALLKQVYPHLKNNIDNIYAIESPLFSHKLKAAGTVDLIAEYKGILSIIDFKTTINEKDVGMIEDYFIQTTLYAIMFSEMYGIVPKQSVIIMAKDYGFFDEAQVFIGNPKTHVERAIKRVKEYHKK